MTGTTDPARMSAERKVADAIVLERALNVVRRTGDPGYQREAAEDYLAVLADRLRHEAHNEWATRDG